MILQRSLPLVVNYVLVCPNYDATRCRPIPQVIHLMIYCFWFSCIHMPPPPPIIRCGFIYIHMHGMVLTFRHPCSSIMHITFIHTWPTIHAPNWGTYQPNLVQDILVQCYTWLAYLLENHAMLGCIDALANARM